MLTEEGVANSKLLCCAEKSFLPTWPRQIRDRLDGTFHVSEEQVVMRIVLGLSELPNIVRPVHGDKLNSSDGNRCPGVKTGCIYLLTASAVLARAERLRRLHRGCHNRLKREWRAACALSVVVLPDKNFSKVGVQAGF